MNAFPRAKIAAMLSVKPKELKQYALQLAAFKARTYFWC